MLNNVFNDQNLRFFLGFYVWSHCPMPLILCMYLFPTGLLTMAGSVTGALVGGWVIKKFDLKFRGLVIFGMVCVIAVIAAGCGFLLRCPDAPMAGVTVAYDNRYGR